MGWHYKDEDDEPISRTNDEDEEEDEENNKANFNFDNADDQFGGQIYAPDED